MDEIEKEKIRRRIEALDLYLTDLSYCDSDEAEGSAEDVAEIIRGLRKQLNEN